MDEEADVDKFCVKGESTSHLPLMISVSVRVSEKDLPLDLPDSSTLLHSALLTERIVVRMIQRTVHLVERVVLGSLGQ